MVFLSVLALSVGLSMDAMAVAAAHGLATPKVSLREVLRVALCFGGFQAIMPLLGFLLGHRFGSAFEAWDHWIAFALLAGIGGKMLYEAWRGDDDAERREAAYTLRVLAFLGLVTSIDAFAAGLTLPALGVPIAVSIVSIGVTTGLLSAIGLIIGRRVGAAFGQKLDVAGGLILIALGAKVLVEHLAGGA